ncbi:MAG TPA: DUF4388 domain-containing protein [Vicinamibacterales bacterium]|nr:DUF4388 domain-containing protein [Vicinamibacterales bacterium]
MVEGDLVDLTLPSLLQVMSRECSTAILRMQRGSDHGAMYFAEGVLVHAVAGPVTGDEAACELLGWPDGRFRLARDAEPQPRTVTDRLARLVIDADTARPGARASQNTGSGERSGDEQLLHDLLTQLTRLEQDTTRLQEGQVEGGTVAALLLVTAVVNSMVAVVTARCSDPGVLPSHVLPRLAEEHPYTQLLGEDRDRISVATAAGVLKSWKNNAESRDQLYLELCRALLDVLTFYGNTASTFFKSNREREEWRATFSLFVDGLTDAINKVDEPQPAPHEEPPVETSERPKAKEKRR